VRGADEKYDDDGSFIIIIWDLHETRESLELSPDEVD
jgi:hypothetical protein